MTLALSSEMDCMKEISLEEQLPGDWQPARKPSGLFRSKLSSEPAGDIGVATGMAILGCVRYDVRRLSPLGRTWALVGDTTSSCGLLITMWWLLPRDTELEQMEEVGVDSSDSLPPAPFWLVNDP